MKTDKKKDKRLTIRINDEDDMYLTYAAFCIGQDKSKLVRMFIDTTINGIKLKVKQGEIKLEDIKAVLDD